MLNRTIVTNPIYIGVVSHSIYTLANLVDYYNRQINKNDFPDFHTWLNSMVASGKFKEIKEKRFSIWKHY